MNISQALAALSEKYPSTYFSIDLTVNSHPRENAPRNTETEISVYVGHAARGEHYYGTTLEMAVANALAEGKASVAAVEEVVAEVEKLAAQQPHPANDPVNLATAILNASL